MSFRRDDAPGSDEVNRWFAELKHESCADLLERIRKGEGPRIVDVRSAGEARTRRIPGSVLVPLQQFEDRMDELLEMPGPLYVHCEHGVRSVDACLLLKWQGRHDVVNVKEGLSAWTGPTESG
jgi:rhodanese-related sulfurtransferase